MIDISVKNLTKFFVIGENLLDGLSFEVQEGECVAILGRNGCGKTTLFKILTGEMDYDDGEVYVNPHKRLGLISQIPVFPEGFTVEQVLRSAFSQLDAIRNKMSQLEQAMTLGSSRELLAQYDDLAARFQAGGGYDVDVETDKVCNGLGITPQQRQQLFSSLSGGEKTRMTLARLLLEKTDILLLDEPTNHLDLRSVEWLEGYINSFKGTVLAISHDRYFLDKIANRIFSFEGDGVIRRYEGNYSDYRAVCEREGHPVSRGISEGSTPGTGKANGGGAGFNGETSEKSDSRATWKNREQKVKFSYKEQKEYETIDADIAALEEKIAALEEEIAASATNYGKLQELSAAKEAAEATLEEKMDRWVYLNELAEQIENQK